MIKSKSLMHSGGYYPYSIHTKKLKVLSNNGFTPLKKFLDDTFSECPDQYFNGGPRSSTLKTKLQFDIIEVQGHEVSALAETGLEVNHDRLKGGHLKVQAFMIENDSSTIAMEVPLWMQHHELENFTELFRTIEPLTGHIDILRIEHDKLWVWDYKPKAAKEKYASTQVYFYALMLSKRTGIPLEKIRCGWFDDKDAFLFKPKHMKIGYNKELTNL